MFEEGRGPGLLVVMEEGLGFWDPGSWESKEPGIRNSGSGGGVKGLGAPTPGNCGRRGLAARSHSSRKELDGVLGAWLFKKSATSRCG